MAGFVFMGTGMRPTASTATPGLVIKGASSGRRGLGRNPAGPRLQKLRRYSNAATGYAPPAARAGQSAQQRQGHKNVPVSGEPQDFGVFAVTDPKHSRMLCCLKATE